MLHSIWQQIWKTHPNPNPNFQPQDWKRSVFILGPKKDNAKECSNYLTTALISLASRDLPHSSVSKESTCNARDLGSVPGFGRSSGEGNGNPLQYSCLENPMDRGAWQATVHEVARVRHDLATKPSPPPPPLASQIMLKILQARLQQYVNHEILDVQAGFRKGRGTRDQITHNAGSQKMQGNSGETSTSASLTMLKSLTVWITTNCGKFLKRRGYQTTLPASWETWVQVKKQALGLHGAKDWFKIGKEYMKAVYCHPAYLTYMQSTACEMPGWMKLKLESRLPGEKSVTSDMQKTPS